MFTDNRKEEMGIIGSQIKGVEKEVFTDVNASFDEAEEIQDPEDIIATNQLFYSNQSNYDMDGESLW